MQQTLLPEQQNIDIKSPIFKPKLGWGGQIKKWLKNNFSSRILPILAIITFALGLYRILR